MSEQAIEPQYPTDEQRLAFAASLRPDPGINDTDRLNALITLFGGYYAYPAMWRMSELFSGGRRGLDAFLSQNPALLGSKAQQAK